MPTATEHPDIRVQGAGETPDPEVLRALQVRMLLQPAPGELASLSATFAEQVFPKGDPQIKSTIVSEATAAVAAEIVSEIFAGMQPFPITQEYLTTHQITPPEDAHPAVAQYTQDAGIVRAILTRAKELLNGDAIPADTKRKLEAIVQGYKGRLYDAGKLTFGASPDETFDNITAERILDVAIEDASITPARLSTLDTAVKKRVLEGLDQRDGKILEATIKLIDTTVASARKTLERALQLPTELMRQEVLANINGQSHYNETLEDINDLSQDNSIRPTLNLALQLAITIDPEAIGEGLQEAMQQSQQGTMAERYKAVSNLVIQAIDKVLAVTDGTLTLTPEQMARLTHLAETMQIEYSQGESAQIIAAKILGMDPGQNIQQRLAELRAKVDFQNDAVLNAVESYRPSGSVLAAQVHGGKMKMGYIGKGKQEIILADGTTKVTLDIGGLIEHARLAEALDDIEFTQPGTFEVRRKRAWWPFDPSVVITPAASTPPAST